MNFNDWLSLVGAGGILAAYALLQAGRMGRDDASYNALNAVASGLLTQVAWVERQPGFVVLELAWALLSLAGLWRAVRRRGAAAP